MTIKIQTAVVERFVPEAHRFGAALATAEPVLDRLGCRRRRKP